MAENETLDLMGRNSGRWRDLWRLMEKGERIDEIHEKAVRCLYTTYRRIYEDVPVGDLLRAACGEDGDVEQLARDCRTHTDYVDLFRLEASAGSDRKEVARGVSQGIVDRFLDQIGMKMLLSQDIVDIPKLRGLFASIKSTLAGPIDQLSGQLARNPDAAPRRPAATRETRERQQKELLTTSLLGR